MIHETAIVRGNTWIDPTAEIGPFCQIGSDHGALVIGRNSLIRAYTTIEGGSDYGEALETGQYVFLRHGNAAGVNLRIGSYSSLEGGGSIGDYVRIHGRCEMTKGVIRDFGRVYGGTYITDNRLPPSNINVPAILDEGSVVCMNSVVIAGVRVGLGAFVGASSVVSHDVPDGMALVGGRLKPVSELRWKEVQYPWTGYYRDDYPPEAWPRIDALHERIMACLR